MHRLLDLPDDRSFGLSGTVRVNPNATDVALDRAARHRPRREHGCSASSHLAGDLGSRASRSLDGDPATSWQAAFGPQDGQQLVIDLRRARHVATSRPWWSPTTATPCRAPSPCVADGEVVGTVAVPPGSGPVEVALPDPPATARRLAVRADDVRGPHPRARRPDPAEILPIAITELTGTGIPRARDAVEVEGSCRPLLSVDGTPVEVRASGRSTSARSGLALEPCGPPLELAAGPASDRCRPRHRMSASTSTGSCSAPTPTAPPGALGVRGPSQESVGTQVEVTGDVHGTDYDLVLESDGAPFWLVLGQSDSSGWQLDVAGASVGPRQMVDGYANGWLVTPDAPGTAHGQRDVDRRRPSCGVRWPCRPWS